MVTVEHPLIEDDIVVEEECYPVKRNSSSTTEVRYSNDVAEEDKKINSFSSEENRANLTGQERWNIFFCFLAWACNVSIVTLGMFDCFAF